MNISAFTNTFYVSFSILTICHELTKIYRLWHQQLLPIYKFVCAIFIRRRSMTLIIFQPTPWRLPFSHIFVYVIPSSFPRYEPVEALGPGSISGWNIMKMGDYTKTFRVKYFTCRWLKNLPNILCPVARGNCDFLPSLRKTHVYFSPGYTWKAILNQWTLF